MPEAAAVSGLLRVTVVPLMAVMTVPASTPVPVMTWPTTRPVAEEAANVLVPEVPVAVKAVVEPKASVPLSTVIPPVVSTGPLKVWVPVFCLRIRPVPRIWP